MNFAVKNPGKNTNDTGNPTPAKIGPGKNDPAQNDEQVDYVPDHPPEIEWQPAAPSKHKPMKLR